MPRASDRRHLSSVDAGGIGDLSIERVRSHPASLARNV